MKNLLWLLLSVLGLASTGPLLAGAKPTATSTPVFSEKDYYVRQSMVLNKSRDGFEGKVELLLDKKLKKEKKAEDMEENGEDIGGSSIYKPAVLQWFSKDGQNQDQVFLDGAAVSLVKKDDLYGNGRVVFQLRHYFRNPTISWEEGWFFQISQGHLEKLPMELMSEYNNHLRSAQEWKLVPSQNGKGQDVLSVTEGNGGAQETTLVNFTTVNKRYYFDGNRWVSKAVTLSGNGDWNNYCEKFPPLYQFPSIPGVKTESASRPDSQDKTIPKGYYAYQKISLKQEKDGFAGELRILLDDSSRGFENPLDYILDNAKHAVLELLDGKGKVFEKRNLKSAYAQLKEQPPSPGRISLYVLEQLLLYENDPYYHHRTTEDRLLKVEGGRIAFFESKDIQTHQSEPMVLLEGGGCDDFINWKWDQAQKENNKELLAYSVHCEACMCDEASGKFQMVYKRYRFDGTKWLVARNEVIVDANDSFVSGGWPQDESGFPKIP